MGAPLLAFSLISTTKSSAVIGYLTEHKRTINLAAGLIMLVISVYYLVCVFSVFGEIPGIDPVCRSAGSIFRIQGTFT